MLDSARKRVITAAGATLLASGCLMAAGGQAFAATHTSAALRPVAVVTKAQPNAVPASVTGQANAQGLMAAPNADAQNADDAPHFFHHINWPDFLRVHYSQQEVLFFAKSTQFSLEEKDN